MFKTTMFILILFSFALNAFGAGGDDLVKTWRSHQEAYAKGETLVERNSLEAISRMKNLLKKYKWSRKKKISMLHKLADLHLNTGRILENNSTGSQTNPHTIKALKIYKSIIEAYPNYEKLEYVLFSSGFEHFMKKNYVTAQKTLKILNNRFPNSKFRDDSYVLRADSFFELKSFNNATNLYEKGEKSTNQDLAIYSRYRKSWSLFNQRKYNKAYSTLFALAKFDKKTSTNNLYSSGEALTDLPRFFQKQSVSNSAFSDFTLVAGLKKSEFLLYELSDFHFESGEWTKAIHVFETLTKRYPSSKMKSVYYLKKGIALSTDREIRNSSKEIKKGLNLCKTKLCKGIAQDDIFKLVNDWEKHWRKRQSDKPYAMALANVYPSLAEITASKSEKSKIYLLLAEVEYHSKNFVNASMAFEKSYKVDPSATYAKQARWGAIDSLMSTSKQTKWDSKSVSRLSRLVNDYIAMYPAEKDSVIAQNFLAKVYKTSGQPNMAAKLYKNVSEKYLYSKSGESAYNNYLAVQVKQKNYKATQDYLLNLKKIDKKGLKHNLINKDLDQLYEEWTGNLVQLKKPSQLVSVYDQALKNRSNSSFKKDWVWNRAMGLIAVKQYAEAAQGFVDYEKEFGNRYKKRLEALNNALIAFKKSKKYNESLFTIQKLLKYDRDHSDDWLVESVDIHIETRNYITGFETLSQVDRSHPQKNIIFERILKKLGKKDLDKVRRANLSSFSGESVAKLLLKLIDKIDDYDSQQTKSAALRLKNIKTDDSNYSAKGYYILAIHEFRKFKNTDFRINSKLQKSLDRMLKKVIIVDGHYRDSIARASGETQTKALMGLGKLYYQVAHNYTKYAKKRLKSKSSISEIQELTSPFLEQSKVFFAEAKISVSGIQNKKVASRYKSIIKKLSKKSENLESWYKRNTQINLANLGGQ